MCDGNSNRMAVVSDFQEDSRGTSLTARESGPPTHCRASPPLEWGAQALHTTVWPKDFYLKEERAIQKYFNKIKCSCKVLSGGSFKRIFTTQTKLRKRKVFNFIVSKQQLRDVKLPKGNNGKKDPKQALDFKSEALTGA